MTTHLRTVKAFKILTNGRTEDVELVIGQQTYVGSGVFSNVYKTQLVSPDFCTVAIKKTWPDPNRENRQIGMHQYLHHKHISQLLYYFDSPQVKQKCGVCSNLVLNYMPSNVRKLQEEAFLIGIGISTFDIKLWMYQLFLGLSYMHSKSICHRDLKPENLLVEPRTGFLQIADLGSAKQLTGVEISDPYQVTRYYRAPELCLGHTKYGLRIDIWAAGCVMAELAANQVLWQGENSTDQLNRIEKTLGTPTVDQVLAMCPSRCEHTWTNQCQPKRWETQLRVGDTNLCNLVAELLVYAPNKRLSAVEATRHCFFDQMRDPNTRLPNGRKLPFDIHPIEPLKSTDREGGRTSGRPPEQVDSHEDSPQAEDATTERTPLTISVTANE